MSGGGTVQTHATNTNGIYDPNQTGAGHQPYLRDSIAALYQYYEVLYFTVKSSFVPLPDNMSEGYFGQMVAHSADAIPSTGSADEFKEHPRCNWKLVPRQAVTDITYVTMEPKQRIYTLYKKVTPRKWVLDKENNESVASSNPSEKIYHYVWTTPLNESTTFGGQVSQIMTYYVRWSRPFINQAES